MVIQHRVEQLRSEAILSLEACEVVEEALSNKADGTFLWISLVLENIMQLKSRGLAAVKKRVHAIPKELDELYEHGLPEPVDGDEDTESSRRLLRILLAATRPLGLEEINICLGLNSPTRKLSDIEDEPDISHAVKGFGGFFVRIVQSKVSLVHQTAREFLLREDSTTAGLSWRHSLSLLESNLDIARSCVTFLLLEDWVSYRETHLKNIQEPGTLAARFLGGLPERLRSFYEYAAGNWSIHVKAGGTNTNFETPNELQNSIATLCDQAKGSYHIWWSCYFIDEFSISDKECLHYAASRGDLVVLRELQSTNQLPVTQRSLKGFDVLTVGAQRGQEEIVAWMLSTFDARELQIEEA